MRFFCPNCGQGLDSGDNSLTVLTACPKCRAPIASQFDPAVERRTRRRAVIVACVLALLALLHWLFLQPDRTGFHNGVRAAIFGHHLTGKGTGAGTSGQQGGRSGPQAQGTATADASEANTTASASEATAATPVPPTRSPNASASIAGGAQAATRENAEATTLPSNLVTSTNVATPATPAAVRLNIGYSATGAVGAASAPGFFGSRGRGTKFVYVVDRSSSMALDRFDAARNELISSLRRLQPGMFFYVIFFDNRHEAMRASSLQPAASLPQFLPWIESQQPGGGTDPEEAMKLALQLQPDTIWLLSDGQFSSRLSSVVRDMNRNKRVAINTIAFHERFGEVQLREIATENNGEYRFVPPPTNGWSRGLAISNSFLRGRRPLPGVSAPRVP